MSGYRYQRSEPQLWTVGSGAGDKPSTGWLPESDHSTAEAAAARVHYLNGGNPAHDDLIAALRTLRAALRRAHSDGYLDFGDGSAPDYLDEADAALVSALAKAGAT